MISRSLFLWLCVWQVPVILKVRLNKKGRKPTGFLYFVFFSYVTSDGIERDENGDVIDSVEPSAATILELMNAPELTHKGEWFAWFEAVFICVFNTISILFADELFRWSLAFRIRNVDHTEPSDWEIAGRYIGWTVLTIIALVLFIMGLQ